jgi:hypothetical protein
MVSRRNRIRLDFFLVVTKTLNYVIGSLPLREMFRINYDYEKRTK